MKTRSKNRKGRQGLTLMEVLLVLAILVILGAIVFVNFSGVFEGSKKKAAQAQIDAFETQLDVYQLDVGSYPTTQQSLQALRLPPSDLANPQKWNGPYADQDIPLDPWDRPYKYELAVDQFNQAKPRIWSSGPDGQDGTADDISNFTVQQ